RLSYLGFVSLGLPDTVLGAAWPAMRAELGLPLDAAGVVLLVTTCGVVVSSVSSSRLRALWQTGRVLTASTVLAALALALTATAQHWGVLIGAALVAGLGGGAIDAALNEHVARHYAARHLTWLHACWGIGAATAPLIVASVLAAGSSWRWAYGVLALLETLLSLSFLQTMKLWSHAADASHAGEADTAGERLGWPMAASMCLFYAYCGLEASTGLWAASYLIGTHALPKAQAGALVGLFWGALTFGRIVVGLRADQLGPTRVVRVASRCALVACLALAVPGAPAWVAALALAGLGLSLAPIYPLVMHDTPTRFRGPMGTRLVGYQVAAGSLGTATLPWLLGAVSERTSLSLLPVLLLVVAAFVLALQHARLRLSGA
ncbi:MAG TPA: MFS transporter, partial [Polyangiales bacterium]